ncbi:hypothetical protein [Caulobacter sp. 17J65-9]|uniref:hypothetical protein n=1 Tax=Caulobacter sp. 17J65-9 TaxID=2709382 RepID=UPI001F08F64F|nr:hypothetical protein [Caulobacter sp. 17J65-9]
MKSKLPDRKAAARRAALRALAKAKRTADKAGVTLSEWEDEFLGSVAERVKTYGRAFGDPEKGDPNAPLSVMQAVKLKQIAAKATGEKPDRGAKSRRGFRPRPARQIDTEIEE